MYLIVVYDAGPKRGTKLLKFLRQHLIWVQNSVFEGEVTEAGFEVIRSGIKERINTSKDSIIYYTFDSQSYTQRGIMGIEKNDTGSFI
ncbi:MAG: CRISPR-associated endonuclease Cas2 [Ignavibacteria bacterium]|nr:CRISPR-associated endonuclease Cas2 [Ignavibacteria bacterium]MCU7504658.1 CRISPR-associated endonuclease Cas2 [Ignavibacteria bacterium]MCU7517534.1 CRISPR-associated endonuclease Cas2 [Ignavibacteria bacterium]